MTHSSDQDPAKLSPGRADNSYRSKNSRKQTSSRPTKAPVSPSAGGEKKSDDGASRTSSANAKA